MTICSTTKKKRYGTRLDAQIGLSMVDMKTSTKYRRQRFSETPQRVYSCEFCRGWHLTSQPRGR